MNNYPSCSKSKQDDDVFEDEIFDDSTFLAAFENNSFKQSESNINDTVNKSCLNVSALCCDEEISGYDKLTGKTWIYPTNYPVRDYQFNIIQAALFKNTLVSLPTGLGKTFIAAVIMYNFYRWYPLGKVIFMAPTRPLVAQQIEACYNIIAMPPNDTIEMTGHMQVSTRKTHWLTKRVVFATPQVIYNDIKSGICPGDKIRCLVIDEAHRARGNYAYGQIVATLDEIGHKTYRLLALSATPGNKIDDVINVVKSLHIAHLELRLENCIDVAPYSHTRKINTVVVPLEFEIEHLRKQYIEILDVYARRLKQLNILPQNLGNLSKGRVVMLYKEFQNRDRANRHPQHGIIMKDFTALIVLFHGLELLVKHGMRVFLNFFDEHPEKTWIQADDQLTALLERLRDDMGINPLSLDRSMLPDGTVPEIPKDLCFGHPKFDKLQQIMVDHFTEAKRKGQDTRAIVFCEYRESVNLVHCLLLQCRPLITPQMFVGQGASGKEGKTVVSLKQQLRVMRAFREGVCNTLVATCVAEEGLDVGSVDLIICFDVSNTSPIRLVQRCGRTGRERGGNVYILVTEGREHQTLLECMRQRDGLNKKVLQSKEVANSLYKMNPRMVPRDFTPRCQKMYITVAHKPDYNEKKRDSAQKKGQKDLRNMFLGRASSSSSTPRKDGHNNDVISKDEFEAIFPNGMPEATRLVESKECWATGKETFSSMNHKAEVQDKLLLSSWLEWQRTLQRTVNIGHSRDSEILSELLQYSDAKQSNMPPSSQNPVFQTQDLVPSRPTVRTPAKVKQSKKKQTTKSPARKDGDIRALFSTATKSTKNYTKLINDLGIHDNSSIPTSLVNLIVDLNINNTKTKRVCYICQNICECTPIKTLRQNRNQPAFLTILRDPKLPDLDLIDDIDADSILKCMKNTQNDDMNISKNSVDAGNQMNCSNNFDLEFDFDDDFNTPGDKTNERDDQFNGVDKNFDIGDIEDIFADSSPEEAVEKVETVENDVDVPKEAKEALGFFGLNSIDDIFADDDSIELKSSIMPKPIQNDAAADNTTEKPVTAVSPSILSGKMKEPVSPILCSQVRRFQLSTKQSNPQSCTLNKIKKLLFQDTKDNQGVVIIHDDKGHTKSSVIPNSLPNTSNKSMFTVTQLVEMINKTNDSHSVSKSNTSNGNTTNIEQNDERSTSPILLTQAERNSEKAVQLNNIIAQKADSNSNNKCTSLIILDSDSDTDETEGYELTEANHMEFEKPINTVSQPSTPTNNKRKFEPDNDTSIASPFFNKKLKLDNAIRPQTIQEKVLAALNSNKKNQINNHHTVLNVAVSQPNLLSQKENECPQLSYNTKDKDGDEKSNGKCKLDMLQRFRKDSKLSITKHKFDSIFKKSPVKAEQHKKKIEFSDSDDDFIVEEKNCRSEKLVNNYRDRAPPNYHKIRKKKKKQNSFLELEAELSGSEGQNSGDELTDESIGSIIDFICDDNVTHPEDMHALYLNSIKSPIRCGAFKIPELPKKFNNAEILSQFVEEDAYEMDSFCVDSHVGLTQVNEVSDLELAEIVLENERKSKRRKKLRTPSPTVLENGESPIVRRKNIKRRIESDSDDSS